MNQRPSLEHTIGAEMHMRRSLPQSQKCRHFRLLVETPTVISYGRTIFGSLELQVTGIGVRIFGRYLGAHDAWEMDKAIESSVSQVLTCNTRPFTHTHTDKQIPLPPTPSCISYPYPN